ncbi:hypothetical protein Tco_1097362 [Tanacetum coccineum]
MDLNLACVSSNFVPAALTLNTSSSNFCTSSTNLAAVTSRRLLIPTSSDLLSVGLRLEMLSSLAQKSFTRLQKSYADRRCKPLEFQVGDKVMLKVSPWKGVIRFGKQGKLNPRYIGPFKVLAKVGIVAYQLELPDQISHVHSTFHVSNLKKCLSDEPLAILLDEIQIDDKLNFIEKLVEIMDQEFKRLKQSHIPIMKVCSNSRQGPEFTWEREGQMKKKYVTFLLTLHLRLKLCLKH